MARARATLRDVAERVGVHSSTVSRVLNPKTRPMVSKPVAERVLETAKEMGYRANPFAYSLKTNRSFTVGVLIPDITNPLFPPIIRGIERVLGPAGYTTILADSDEDPDIEQGILDRMRARQVDGLILATAHRADHVVEECKADGIPFVLINRTMKGEGIYSVTNDDFGGIAMAVDHLADLGHKRIAHLAGPQDLSTGFDRRRGFLEAIKARGLEADPELIHICGALSEEEGRVGLDFLLDNAGPFTAVVAANDMLALGCYDALEARGLRCPGDLSVTGFNDMPFVDKFSPPLTTVRIPHYEMGNIAANILLSLLEGEGDELPQSVCHTLELIVRGSTAEAPT